MKPKTIFFVLLSFISIQLNAQFSQGDILLGISSAPNLSTSAGDILNFGFSSDKTKSDAVGFEEQVADKTLSMSLNPKIGFLVTDNVAVGANFNIGFARTKVEENLERTVKQTVLAFGPFVRYYMEGEKVIPYFELGGTLGSSNFKAEYVDRTPPNDGESKNSIMTLGGGAGLAFQITDHIMFDALLGYSTRQVKRKGDNDDNRRSITNNLGVRVGFTLLFGN